MHDEGDPKTYAEAISSRDANFLKEAINDEKHSHLTYGTWIYCDLPPGAKQAPMQWHEKFDKVALSYGFVVNDADKCIYSTEDKSEFVILCLYVDDMLIFGSDLSIVEQTKKFLSSNFDMKDLGEADVILGIKILSKGDELVLTESHYIEKFLKKYGHFDHKPALIPLDPSVKLTKNTDRAHKQLEYSSVVGSLIIDCITDACKEAEWLRNLLVEIPLWMKPVPSVMINCDNQDTIYKVSNKTYNGKSRHASLRHQIVRQLLKRGVVAVNYIESKNNLADPFTKCLPKDVHSIKCKEMGLRSVKEV
ncbi:uncharacterized protein LOC113291402 [Papaver somniferum]|uniref:uncharacterized protein LOC113291402 n=1 Tax=Papaver somniferum TaxID=3469 RepID=UPI000E6FA57D|nr:uncharacterized protein LOC113291402 [Papaver somniferum]